jgi:hypothetical protein
LLHPLSFQSSISILCKCPDLDSFVHVLSLQAINLRLSKCPDLNSFVNVLSLQAIISRLSQCPDPQSIVHVFKYATNNFQIILVSGSGFYSWRFKPASIYF